MGDVIGTEVPGPPSIRRTLKPSHPASGLPGLVPAWLAYTLAVLLTMATLVGRLTVGPAPGDLPMLVLFLIPIILSAYLGGLGPGLVATAIAALGTDYFLLPPVHSFQIDRAANLITWSIFIVDGVLVSVLTEALHRSRNIAHASQMQLRSLVEHAPVSLAMFDRDLHYIATSRRWLTDYGHGLEDLIGRHHHDVLPDLPARWKEAHARGLAGEVVEDSDELWIRADGTRTRLRWAVHPWRDARGHIGGIVVSAEDITARKQAEEQQARSQKLEALGTLAGGIAHDFNNILFAINGNTQLALGDLPPDAPARESLTEIAKAGARATSIIRRILAFSRPQEQNVETLRLAPVVNEALKLLRATLPAMLDIRTTFAPDLPLVAADPGQIHQALVNLVTNAAQAIGDGVGLIDVRLDAATVTAEAAGMSPDLREGRYCRLSISDSGCGIDRAAVARIFDPFFTTKTGGTGLGLSVVHGIVKSHQGAVTVDSQPGKGTTFHLYFPAAEGTVASAAVASRAVAPARSARVLYVDDDESLVFLARRALERLGYTVTGASDPARALQDFRARPTAFDVVVTDLSMPGMSGFELARELLSTRPLLPIVMTSGYLRPGDQEAALAAGIRELILKPDTVDELGHALDRLLRGPEV